MEESEIARCALEAHEELDQEIERLRQTLDASPEGLLANWMERCIADFRHFHTQLRRHIDMEEEGGFMAPVSQRRPTLSPKIEKLQQEHRELIERCVAIDRFFDSWTDSSDQHISAIRQKIDALLQALHAHETTENQLVQEAFSVDIGSGD